MRKQIAITGGTGLIGSTLARLHHGQGDRVRILSRHDGSNHFVADLCDRDVSLDSFMNSADILYHCAGELHDESRMHELHVEATRRLLAAGKGRIGHWVQLSSVGAYGPYRSGVVDESTREAPHGTYEQTKAKADRLVASSGISYSVVRPSIVYGPSMPNLSLFQMIAMVSRGLFFYVGPTGTTANYVHVEGVAKALYLCGTSAAAMNQTFIVSDHQPFELVIETVAQSLGRPPPQLRLPEQIVRMAARWFGQIPGIPLSESRVDALTTRVKYDDRRIRACLGYQHPISMRDGFVELVDRWQSQY